MSKLFVTKSTFSCNAHEVSLDNFKKFIVFSKFTPSCLDVFFSSGEERGEGINFILLPHHHFNITLVGKMFSFS